VSAPQRASYDEHARDRRVGEQTASPSRTDFERDRARVLHSAALRRLAAKTQVVGVGEDDFPRTRLTHSLECAQIGRELGAALGCDPDLVDAACLAHDLGHPPFGHNGEAALDVAARDCGGFEGNAQSLRILCRLETKVVDSAGRSAGLNLTRATLDAATKYPWPRQPGMAKFGVYDDDRAAFDWVREGAPGSRRCLEAQVMDWADDVAYSVHDLEDGVHAGYVHLERLAGDREEQAALCSITAAHYGLADDAALQTVLADLLALPVVRDVPPHDGGVAAHVALKRLTNALIGRFVRAALAATREAYGDGQLAGYAGGGPLARYDADLQVPERTRAECALLKGVTVRYVMGRPGAASLQRRQREVIAELVAHLAGRAPDVLDPGLRGEWASAPDDRARLRVVIDQVARLTDTSALAWHDRLVRRVS